MAVDYGLMNEAGGGKVFFTGPIYDRDELRAWNTRADLFLFPSTFDTNGLVVREAAACGLASVLIRDSCAAEGITDDRNGFIIGESAKEMADLLARLCKDLDHVHDVGQHAMDEIYLSWQECVNRAYERYQYILARNKIGALPHHRKQATDMMVKFTAKTMEEQDRLRRITMEGHDLFQRKTNDILRELHGRAVAVAEGAKVTSEAAKLMWNDIFEDLWTEDDSGQ